LVASYQPIGLSEMDSVELMDRFDYKVVFTEAMLPLLLDGLKPQYRMLAVKDTRLCHYENRYFDTPERSFFLAHHNQKGNRFKVRFRRYVDSDITFFEVKFKTNKGKTIKQRVSVKGLPEKIDPSLYPVLLPYMEIDLVERLEPVLDNNFTRITLVNNNLEDRLTVDTDVRFSFNSHQAVLADTVIAELKQDGAGIRPFLRDLFRGSGVLPIPVSKYVMGCMLLDPRLKYNNFKSKIQLLNKFRHAA
jgi:hypothetical protein